MFCSKCGQQWPESMLYCGKCGTALTAVPQPEPVDQDATVRVRQTPQPEPVNQEATVHVRQAPPQPYTPPAPQPASKPVYQPAPNPVYQPAPKPTKQKNPAKTTAVLSKFVVATMLLSILLVLISGIVMLNTNITDMSTINWAIRTFTDQDLEEELDDVIALRTDFRNNLNQSIYSRDEEELVEDFIDKTTDLKRNNSILALIRYGEFISENASTERNATLTIDEDDLETIEDLLEKKTMIYLLLACLYLIPVLMALVAGLTKNRGMTIACAVFTLLVQIIFSTNTLIVPCLLVYIAQFVLCLLIKVKKAPAMTHAQVAAASQQH